MHGAAREHLTAIFRAGLAAVDPAAAVRAHVSLAGDRLRIGDAAYDLSQVRNVVVVGNGKASAHMAGAIEDVLGDRVTGGWVNVKAGHGLDLDRIHVHEAGHPVPDEAGVSGALKIMEMVRAAGADDLVLCCISGGGSALLPLPAEGLTLDAKQAVTRELLGCGATINELNAVRKHLSGIKGGQLARAAAPAGTASLVLSDVIGDPLDTIASGPTAPDPTTFADALAVIERYDLLGRAPRSVIDHLRKGVAGDVQETPKPGDPLFDGVRNVLVGNNRAAIAACRREAESLGYRPVVLTSTLQGEASQAAGMLAAAGEEALAAGQAAAASACLICGGETTVTIRGTGKGGRNQEFALAAAVALDGKPGLTLLAAGTDGTDGPTDAAGAFADGDTCRRAEALGLHAAEFLANNDSYHFFDPLGDLLKTGPTGTNVMDLYLLLAHDPQPQGDGR